MFDFTRVRAFTIHVFTATGAGLAFLALVFATGGHWAAMFFTFGARAHRRRHRRPAGARL